ncbi:hypothetical protein ABT093_25950 [Kitasatospora sp. NPDC002551]|uniref:hypothetical protein n=1 Tax=unclassified Kitasatospora TaxID=2633591 RepID=UPI00333305D0
MRPAGAGPDGVRRAVRRALAGAAVAVLAVAVLGGCSSTGADQPAPPGSPGARKLEPVLNAFGLVLPDCRVEDLRFAGTARRGEERLALRFRAPHDCVQDFLKAQRADVARPLHWTPGRERETNDAGLPPILTSRTDELGWTFDPAVAYEEYVDTETPNGSLFLVLVGPGGPTDQVFMDSARAGRTVD